MVLDLNSATAIKKGKAVDFDPVSYEDFFPGSGWPRWNRFEFHFRRTPASHIFFSIPPPKGADKSLRKVSLEISRNF